MNASVIEEKLVCFETGKTFVATFVNGCSNYAKDNKGNVFSDEGVYIRLKRELLTENKVYAYLSGSAITGWKASHKLMKVISKWKSRSGFCGEMTYVEAVDSNGKKWHGKCVDDGHCITMRKMKG